MTVIYCNQVPDARRVGLTAGLFGVAFSLRLEPAVFTMAGKLSPDYYGGYWQFHSMSNGGFYMAPDTDTMFLVACENGFVGRMSADALGIAACLYAYSHLSFYCEDGFTDTCAEQYHLLRELALDHPEAAAILGAID